MRSRMTNRRVPRKGETAAPPTPNSQPPETTLFPKPLSRLGRNLLIAAAAVTISAGAAQAARSVVGYVDSRSTTWQWVYVGDDNYVIVDAASAVDIDCWLF